MPDAWRAYLEMALGLTEAPRKRAQKVVGDLANRGGATAAQLQGLVDDLLSAGVANREALTNIVRHEVDRALGVVGLATAEEVDELTTRVHDLERRLRQAQARASAVENDAVADDATVGGTRIEQPAPLPRKVAKKAVAKKAVKATPNAMPAAATKPAGSSANPARTETPTPAKPDAAQPQATPAEKAAPASKAAPAKKVARKAVAKKAVAKKAEPATPPTTAVPSGTAEAPTAAVKAAAAETELPPVSKPTPAALFVAPVADDAGPVDSSEAGLVDRGEAGLTPSGADGPAKKAAKKAAAKRAPAKKAAGPEVTP